jgi:diguanylate cyclase (GGDEF)-like protein
LRVADEVIGVLNLSDKRSGKPFTETDLSLLTAFAAQAATLIKLSSYHATLDEVKKLSITDSLTNLFNRRYLDIRLEEEYQRAKRYETPLSLAILDIDDFKLFNDSEGHLAGDQILREIALIMAAGVRANDILVRFGGEEFAVIMPQTTEIEAYVVAERIREDIKTLILPKWTRFPKEAITICAGIATYPVVEGSVEDLIRCADRALYEAKNDGKDKTMLWKE